RITEKQFREDLYYRLNIVTIDVPRLADRLDDLPDLVLAFAEGSSRPLRFTEKAMRWLERRPWPGNVRELRNVIERAAVICTTSSLEPEDLPERVRSPEGPPAVAPLGVVPLDERSATLRTLEELGSVPFRDRIRDYEVKLITDALDAAGGNQSRAAEILRMPLRTLVHKIRTYGLKKTYKRDDE
ncbi:MAG: two component, sigma54 specific, transcriptional regulator, Fis family, partial [Myxococcaceae bacterium]|nr:two component, sigma54 specific, transcriptional regulator, Fis family [Myxococcaceae bacterium]